MRGEAHEVRAGAYQHAERRVEVPGCFDQRGEEQAEAQQRDPAFDHHARAVLVHDAANRRADDGRGQEAERERAGRETAVPAELVDQRRQEE